MARLLRSFLLAALSLGMSACLNAAPDPLPWLKGEIHIDPALADFPAGELELSLYHIGPADRAAELVDRSRTPLEAHVQGKATRLPFSLGKASQYQAGERYFFTAYILHDGQRSHAGRCGAALAASCPAGEPAGMQAMKLEFDALPTTQYEEAPRPSRWR